MTTSSEQTHRRRAMNYNMMSFSDTDTIRRQNMSYNETETIRRRPNMMAYGDSETIHHPNIQTSINQTRHMSESEINDANWTAYINLQNAREREPSDTSLLIYNGIMDGTYETLVGPLTTEDLIAFYSTPSIFAELYDDPDLLNGYSELTRLVKASENAQPVG